MSRPSGRFTWVDSAIITVSIFLAGALGLLAGYGFWGK